MKKTKAKIKVIKSPLDLTIVATFDYIEDLLEWNKENNAHADRIVINDFVLLGWDELYDFV